MTNDPTPVEPEPLSAHSRVCQPNHPGLSGSFDQREKKFDLVATLVGIHGRMGA
jgi:hypothetical protein